MSSLSNLPYGKVLDYWYEKLAGHPRRYRFILTKCFELMSFKRTSENSPNTLNSRKPLPFKWVPNAVPNRPKVALVVPVYAKNDLDHLMISALIKSIENQTKSPDKVIIVDDHSPKINPFPDNFEVIRLDQNKGPATARNIGKSRAAQENCDIITFTDSDCILKENWVKNIIRAFESKPYDSIISGHTKSLKTSWYDQYHDINGTLNGRIFKNQDSLLYGTTSNLAITAEVNRKLRFNEDFPTAAGEDIEFCFQAIQNGYKIGHCCEMILFHDFGYNGHILRNFKRFKEQFRRYGKGENLLLKEIPDYYSYFEQTVEISNIQHCIS